MKVSKNTGLHGWRLLPLLLLLLYLFYRQTRYQNRMKQIFEIYDTLRSYGVSERLTRYICAQAAHETGDFTSSIYKVNNNLFGMKLPKLRKTTALYEKNGHAVYANTKDSIKDYFFYLETQGYPVDFNSLDLFIEALHKRGYFEADITEYTKGLKHFLKKYFNE